MCEVNVVVAGASSELCTLTRVRMLAAAINTQHTSTEQEPVPEHLLTLRG